MDIITAIILGVVQGLTEFLPVSSSGHLVLAEYLFGVDPPGMTFEVVLHLGTLGAVLVYFRKQLARILNDLFRGTSSADGQPSGWKYVLIIILGSVPAGALGLFLKDQIDAAFSSPTAAAIFLLVTGIFLFSTVVKTKIRRPLSLPRGFVIGCAQAAALLPGISRSGATISAAVGLGISPGVAAEFSFILSIPAIFGASVLSLSKAFTEGVPLTTLGIYSLGGLAAGIVGYASLVLLFGMIRQGRFWWFGLYCLTVGVAWLIFLH